MSKGARVVVGMSGGVDSSVSAALLKRAGYDVVGAFIKVWQPEWLECSWRDERLDAMRAAAHLGIPFLTADLAAEYKQGVIDRMIAEYRAGRTPNPDVMCNREVKFGAFREWAAAQGASLIATGHYARSEGGRLLVSADADKDQTYFLWTLTGDSLAHALFPVGGMPKPEVRALARKLGLPNAAKKDSQGLCFIGKVDLKEFLARAAGDDPSTRPGAVLDMKGQRIGTHPGALFFTMGERHGFDIDRAHKTPDGAPLYVVAKDIAANTLTVAAKDAGGALPGGALSVRVSGTNWISGAPEAGRKLRARARYRAPLAPATAASIGAGTASFEFEAPQDSLTPGQSLVIYDETGRECLGGGIIEGGVL
ncbi:MAG: tRNA 2-thiouridine(34) synthase MnmA [Patescibacteria group bacterium]|nr:tRNA 2-thiouridine(34) synthase MnmA [Patescibacteria group bacterium]